MLHGFLADIYHTSAQFHNLYSASIVISWYGFGSLNSTSTEKQGVSENLVKKNVSFTEIFNSLTVIAAEA